MIQSFRSRWRSGGVIEAVLWYFFLWYLLDTLRKPKRDLWLAAGAMIYVVVEQLIPES